MWDGKMGDEQCWGPFTLVYWILLISQSMAPESWSLGLLWSSLPHPDRWSVSFWKKPWCAFSPLPAPTCSPRLHVLIFPWSSHSWCHSSNNWFRKMRSKRKRKSKSQSPLWAEPRVPLPNRYHGLFPILDSTECSNKTERRPPNPHKKERVGAKSQDY